MHLCKRMQLVELVRSQKFVGFLNRLFFVSKPNNRWRPIFDLSMLNQFLTKPKRPAAKPPRKEMSSAPKRPPIQVLT